MHDADGFTIVGRKSREKRPTFAQVSLFDSLKQASAALIEKDIVNIAEETREQATQSSAETLSVFEDGKSSFKNLQDGTDFGRRTMSHPEYGFRTEEGTLMGDEVTEVKGQASDEVKGQASGEVKGQASGEVINRPVQTVVCYGLGNISDCAIARYQLALLLLICDGLQVKSSNCHLYDPRFTTEETQALTSLGLTIIPQNEECKRPANEVTLFYMPHCGKPLYNNLLWANWNVRGLADVILIGNSFNNIQERLPSRVLQDFSYLHQIIPHTREVTVKNTFRFTDIFNDTSIHLFPSERLQTLPSAFWYRGGEPEYDPDAATEIILSK